MKEKNNQRKSIVGYLIVVFILAYFVIDYFHSRNLLNKDFRYTIGIVNDVSFRSKAGYPVDFYYSVSGNHFRTHTWIDQFDKSLIGDRFYVKFSPSNPKNCELLLEERVPSYIKESPPEGWEEIPRYLGVQPD